MLISRSVYTMPSSTIVVGQTILPGATGANKTAVAVADASYPIVFQNKTPDPSFGITTSFPSKSEGGLRLSADGHGVTLMGYAAPANTLDVSNSNTPGHPDSTNPVQQTFQRTVATLDSAGNVSLQNVNSFSGNNGRNAVTGLNGVTYLVGNSGNGAKAASTGTLADPLANTGVQIVTPGQAETTSAGSYSITQNGYASDKASKDNNVRGETIYNNTLYATQGSGGNAIAIPPGFNTKLASDPTANVFPFGLFFANDHTLHVTAEGVAVAATSSVLTDQGADANQVVAITDSLAAITLPSAESFSTIAGPVYATVYRGVTETPAPEPASLSLLGMGVAGLLAAHRRR